MEQLVVRERLTLDVLVRLDGADDGVVRDVLYWGFTHDMQVDFERVAATSSRAGLMRHAVTVLGRPLTPSSLAAVADAVAATGGDNQPDRPAGPGTGAAAAPPRHPRCRRGEGGGARG